MNTYLVTVTTTSDFRVRVTADTKQAAGVEAVRIMVRHAKGYNAKYSGQFLPEWMLRPETHDAYTVGAIRCTRKAVAA